ncbi:hypothetical protein [Brevundimonas sp.]|uniref:hypothetical protein n=1 Tax=Brevundimonas sp. TaxID=1871086 RepID=UPI0025FFB95A|nr:hypothetical protein [Brevundimonas sp.]
MSRGPRRTGSTRGSAKSAVVAPPPTRDDARVAAVYDRLRPELVETMRFEALGLEAHRQLGPDVSSAQAAAAADVLFAVVATAAEDLRERSPEAAAELLTAYVRDVLPLVRSAGLPARDVRQLASSLNVMRHLSPAVLPELDPAGAPPAPPAPKRSRSRPSAPAEPAPLEEAETEFVPLIETDEPEAEPGPSTHRFETTEPLKREISDDPEIEDEEEADDTPATVVDPSDIVRRCLSARRNGRKVILIVGLATTGKSFLARRLKTILQRDYTCTAFEGFVSEDARVVGRTKDVLLYQFHYGTKGSPRDFDLYDIPGDWFRPLMQKGFVGGSDDFFRRVYTIFAFADAILFVAPAFHVLQPKLYVEHGDDDPRSERELRRERKEDMDRFIDSLEPMTIAISLLRKEVARRLRSPGRRGAATDEARAQAAAEAVETVGALSFSQIMERRSEAGRLPIPGALLLSRADELLRRVPPSQLNTFDRDPALTMLEYGLGGRYFAHLSRRFAAFTADFLTAQRNDTFTRVFHEERESAGVGSLLRDWLLPAIDHCRRPWLLRALETPTIAMAVRRLFDPAYARAWRRN